MTWGLRDLHGLLGFFGLDSLGLGFGFGFGLEDLGD